ncbi:TauD/TfdA family dioxygenase [Actinomadura sp. ATCC 31491]|uniref:TauD/TfdA family dioxygenase n=1 Tax=Actinomadura luzonensis TaxID=2805427 RepID=A0ABT0G465_9ACTN|nr:TauD/TfdA family dioxygenase [Actinomadura luzonensis]MCK2219392.1 TauD/TfdA family dioxygenase [Actinomadura luzonensis]
MTAVTEARGPGEWLGEQLRDGGGAGWRVRLEEEQREELLTAVRAAESAGLTPSDVARTGLPRPGSPGGAGSPPRAFLPDAGARVRGLLLDGPGFALLQGVPVDGMSDRQRELAALGLARLVGGLVPQGPGAEPLMHVRDTGADPSGPRTRSYEHRGPLGYHSDPTDAVALLCLRPARSGGISTIVGSVALHNELVRTRPDLAGLLYEPWWHDLRRGDGPDSFAAKPLCVRRPGGGISFAYGPDYLRSALRGAHVPPFTPAQEEVMALLDRLAADPRFALAMDLREGDMQFLDNRVVLHGRTAYADHPEPRLRRHLMRLWLTLDA